MSENVSRSDQPAAPSAFSHPVMASDMRSSSNHSPTIPGKVHGAIQNPPQAPQSARPPRHAGEISKISVADAISKKLSQNEGVQR